MAEKKNAKVVTGRRWETPSYRAAYYAVERKKKVHIRGDKEGQEITPTEATFRSGYLQCQGDHAASYKYHKAIADGKTKEEATIISQTVNSRPAKLPEKKKKTDA